MTLVFFFELYLSSRYRCFVFSPSPMVFHLSTKIPREVGTERCQAIPIHRGAAKGVPMLCDVILRNVIC